MMIAESGAAPLPRMVDVDSERLRNLSEQAQLHRDVTAISANQNRLSDVSGTVSLLQPVEALLPEVYHIIYWSAMSTAR